MCSKDNAVAVVSKQNSTVLVCSEEITFRGFENQIGDILHRERITVNGKYVDEMEISSWPGIKL